MKENMEQAPQVEADIDPEMEAAFDTDAEPPRVEDAVSGGTKKKSRALIYSAIAVGAAIAIYIVMSIFSFFGNNAAKPVYSSNVSSEAAGFERSRAGESTRNPEAARLEAEDQARRAQVTEKKGESFLPTEHFGDGAQKVDEKPAGKSKPEEPASQAEPTPPPPPPPPVQPAQQQDGKPPPSPLQTITEQLFRVGEPGVSAGQAPSLPARSAQPAGVYNTSIMAAQPAPNTYDINAGQMFSAEMTLGLNSLVPETPARARLTSGRYRGAILMGGIKNRSNRYLVATFNQMAIGSRTFPIDAIAVSVEDLQAGLADEVNSRFFERYALMAGAGFLQGVGSALLTSGTTTIQSSGSTGTTVTQTNADRTTRDAMIIGLGGAAQAISPMAQELHAEIRPEVKVHANKEIGIVMLKPVSFSAAATTR